MTCQVPPRPKLTHNTNLVLVVPTSLTTTYRTMNASKSVAFPHEPLTPLDSLFEPTPLTARQLRREVYANARSSPTDLGGGDHGHLGLVMPDAEYTAISTGGVPYIQPDRPAVPAYSNVVGTRERQKTKYQQDLEEYRDSRNIHNLLKAQLMVAIPETYREVLADTDIGYSEVTAMELLEHIIGTYGTITTLDLEINLQQLHTPWAPDTPIATVFINGNRCRRFAEEGGDPISDHTYIRTLVKIFRGSGVLDEAIKDWDNKPTVDKTVMECVRHFTREDKYRRDTNQYLKTTLEAHAAGRLGTPQVPTTAYWAAPTVPGPATTTLPAATDMWTYCWTHGISKHNSKTCENPSEGHRSDATMIRRGGGSNQFPGRKKRKNDTAPASANKKPT